MEKCGVEETLLLLLNLENGVSELLGLGIQLVKIFLPTVQIFLNGIRMRWICNFSVLFGAALTAGTC